MEIQKKFQETITRVESEIDHLDKQRENLILLTRKLNRLSGKGVSELVKGKKIDEVENNAIRIMDEIANLVKEVGLLTSWNAASFGVEEYVEMMILSALVNREEIPDPIKLKVPPWLWVLGLVDVLGELRRIIINSLINKNKEQVPYYLSCMHMLFDEIMGLDFPKTIMGSLRNKIDSSRLIMDKTETDVLYFHKNGN
jgi:translin